MLTNEDAINNIKELAEKIKKDKNLNPTEEVYNSLLIVLDLAKNAAELKRAYGIKLSKVLPRES